MRAPRAIHVATLAMIVSGSLSCSSKSSPADDVSDAAGHATHDAGDATASASGDAALTSTETDTFTSGGNAVTLNQQLSTLANQLFEFDPTINPSGSAAANATAIGMVATANLGGCGTVTVSGTTVTVNFGPPPGCTLSDGTVASGTVDLAVSESGGTTTVALTLTSVVVDGEALAGTASFATTNGTMFTVTADITSGASTDSAKLTITGTTDSFTITGNATVTEGSTTTVLDFSDLTITIGECYASGGSVEVTKSGISESLTFNAQTPETGKVSLTVGKHTSTMTLPPYGSCPNSGASRDAGKFALKDAGRDSSRDSGKGSSKDSGLPHLPGRDAGRDAERDASGHH